MSTLEEINHRIKNHFDDAVAESFVCYNKQGLKSKLVIVWKGACSYTDYQDLSNLMVGFSAYVKQLNASVLSVVEVTTCCNPFF